MRILISRLHHPVTVLGPGRRAGIWFQGCTIGCRGCISADTWRADPAAATDTEAVLDWLESLPPEQVDGVTISGGEPTEQPEALAALLAGVGRWRERHAADRSRAQLPTPDVLVYTGRDPDWLDRPEAAVLDGADATIAGPYDASLAGSAPLRGSDNQRIVALTELGRTRYAESGLPPRREVQVDVVDGRLWLIGIPLAGDLARMRTAAAEQGITLRGVSWTG